MGLYEVRLKTGTSIYVLAANECNAVFRSYNKAVAKAEMEPNNESYEKWKSCIEKVVQHFGMQLDESRFNLF